MEPCTVAEIKQMLKRGAFDAHIQPCSFYDYALESTVYDWTDLSLAFVNWLIQYKYLSPQHLPVPNYARRAKFFINSHPAHAHPERDGVWKNIGPYWIDTKYNAEGHVKNILYTLEHLRVPNPHFSVRFNRD